MSRLLAWLKSTCAGERTEPYHVTVGMARAINTKYSTGGDMRLDEIKPAGAAEQRVKRMKASAKAAKDKAKQLKAQADVSADRLDIQNARQKMVQAQRSAVSSNIKPYK